MHVVVMSASEPAKVKTAMQAGRANQRHQQPIARGLKMPS